MVKYLRYLALLTGVICVGIGVYHALFGVDSVIGAGPADATVDSQERFYGALFAGYGAAWILAARQEPISANVIRLLAGTMFLGGAARVISWVDRGAPNWFYAVMMAVEFAVPAVFFALVQGSAKSVALEDVPSRR